MQVGTALLASNECPIHENYKEALIKAKGTDAVVTGRIGGTPVRVLKNRMTKELFEQTDRLIETRKRYFEAFEKLKDTENILVVDGDRDADVIAEEIREKLMDYFVK